MSDERKVMTVRTETQVVDVCFTNYSGHEFRDFFPERDGARGPGWYVFGRNAEKYGTRADGKGAYTMLCARPEVKARKHPHYNISVRRGWRTKAEAQQVADQLNAERK
jgi:hypothetical protein